jgi:glucose-6-phosphate 1-dehydrogenase
MMRAFVIFGASGDLTARYLLPTLARLRQLEKLPPDIRVLGIAPENWHTAFYQSYVAAKLKQHAPEVADAWTNDWAGRLEYRRADVTGKKSNCTKATEMPSMRSSWRRACRARFPRRWARS